jgi:hypothetical protein
MTLILTCVKQSGCFRVIFVWPEFVCLPVAGYSGLLSEGGIAATLPRIDRGYCLRSFLQAMPPCTSMMERAELKIKNHNSARRR